MSLPILMGPKLLPAVHHGHRPPGTQQSLQKSLLSEYTDNSGTAGLYSREPLTALHLNQGVSLPSCARVCRTQVVKGTVVTGRLRRIHLQQVYTPKCDQAHRPQPTPHTWMRSAQVPHVVDGGLSRAAAPCGGPPAVLPSRHQGLQLRGRLSPSESTGHSSTLWRPSVMGREEPPAALPGEWSHPPSPVSPQHCCTRPEHPGL